MNYIKKTCIHCSEEKELELFVKNAKSKYGYENVCKVCKQARRKDQYKNYKHKNVVTEGFKICTSCGEQLNVNGFKVDLKGADGRRTVCKYCDNKRVYAKYRENKGTLSLAFWNKRATSVNSNKRVKTDTFITGLQLKELYDKQNGLCHYCKVELGSIFHVDHKDSLYRGGQHHIDNICITCEPCNRLKYTMNENEFLTFLNDYVSRFENRITRTEG